MAKLVLADTNIIFGLYRRFVLGLPLDHSKLMYMYPRFEIYISGYIIGELMENAPRKGLPCTELLIKDFIQAIGFGVFVSNPRKKLFLSYVYDADDAQILQDAVEHDCNYLLTRNTKDFAVDAIWDTFSLRIIQHLSEI